MELLAAVVPAESSLEGRSPVPGQGQPLDALSWCHQKSSCGNQDGISLLVNTASQYRQTL